MKKMLLVLVAFTLFAASSAFAGTATANLNVTAEVSANCTISANAIGFGGYDPIVTNSASDLDSTGSISVMCTNGSSATVTLDQGSNADSGSTDAAPLRRMLSGSDYLSYVLYSDASRSSVWGNTAGTGVAHAGTGSLTAITVFGRVTAGQNVPAGNYSDTVVATVTF